MQARLKRPRGVLNPGGFDFENWQGVFAPRGTPEPVIARLQQEIAAAVKTPDVQKRMAGIFGFMINAGRFGIFSLGPALLARAMLRRAPLSIRRLFEGS